MQFIDPRHSWTSGSAARAVALDAAPTDSRCRTTDSVGVCDGWRWKLAQSCRRFAWECRRRDRRAHPQTCHMTSLPPSTEQWTSEHPSGRIDPLSSMAGLFAPRSKRQTTGWGSDRPPARDRKWHQGDRRCSCTFKTDIELSVIGVLLMRKCRSQKLFDRCFFLYERI